MPVNIGRFPKVTIEQLVMVKILLIKRFLLGSYHLPKALLYREHQDAKQVQIVRQTINLFWHL
jgi:hypothetical protein